MAGACYRSNPITTKTPTFDGSSSPMDLSPSDFASRSGSSSSTRPFSPEIKMTEDADHQTTSSYMPQSSFKACRQNYLETSLELMRMTSDQAKEELKGLKCRIRYLHEELHSGKPYPQSILTEMASDLARDFKRLVHLEEKLMGITHKVYHTERQVNSIKDALKTNVDIEMEDQV